jgi:hypothetical protein
VAGPKPAITHSPFAVINKPVCLNSLSAASATRVFGITPPLAGELSDLRPAFYAQSAQNFI